MITAGFKCENCGAYFKESPMMSSDRTKCDYCGGRVHGLTMAEYRRLENGEQLNQIKEVLKDGQIAFYK